MNDLKMRGRFLSWSLAAGLAAMTILSGAAASAAVVETVTVQNQYGFAVSSGNSFVPKVGGDQGTFFVPANVPGEESEVGLQYQGTASPGNLFFLHNNYCVGTCSTFSQTVITFNLFNNGRTAVDLRFDSQITPGHIARILGAQGANLNGSFDFRVTEGFGPEPTTLYSANGGVNSDGIYLFSGNLPFNGLTRTSNPNAGWDVLDWGTTNLSVGLTTLGAGQSTQVQYVATYGVSSNAVCDDVLLCGGLQVVFGDPRNDGGVSSLRVSSLAPQLNDPTDPVYPVIGRNYGVSSLFANIVPADSDYPMDPDPFTAPKYGPLFIPSAGVPEPSAWALMVGGIGLVGGVARRRRSIRPAVA